ATVAAGAATLSHGQVRSHPRARRDSRRSRALARHARCGRQGRQGHAPFLARGQDGAVRRNDRGDEPLARRGLPEGGAGGAREDPIMALSAEDLADLRRWAICGAVIVLAHGAIAAGTVNWREEIEAAEPAAAIVIEFAPVPVAPPMPETNIAPGPELVMSEASPARPIEQVEEKEKTQEKVASRPVEEPPPEIKPAPNPDAALEPPRQEVT